MDDINIYLCVHLYVGTSRSSHFIVPKVKDFLIINNQECLEGALSTGTSCLTNGIGLVDLGEWEVHGGYRI